MLCSRAPVLTSSSHGSAPTESASFAWSATATGFGFLTGLGYDIRVGKNISLTPVFNFYFGSDGDLKSNGTTIDSHYKHNVYDFGLGITFH